MEEQRLVCQALANRAAELSLPISETDLERLQFSDEDYEGIDNDDPFFKILDEIEAERHGTTRPLSPQLD